MLVLSKSPSTVLLASQNPIEAEQLTICSLAAFSPRSAAQLMSGDMGIELSYSELGDFISGLANVFARLTRET